MASSGNLFLKDGGYINTFLLLLIGNNISCIYWRLSHIILVSCSNVLIFENLYYYIDYVFEYYYNYYYGYFVEYYYNYYYCYDYSIRF